MTTTPPPTRIADLAVEAIDERHADAIAEHFERCSDYFELVYGHPPGPAERQSMFIALPEGKTYDDKFTFVLLFEDRVVGDIDLIRDYPEPGEWWLGVLLLDPSVRGLGLGTMIVEAFSDWVADNGAKGLRLAVATQNVEGSRFWRSLSFTELERRTGVRQGTRDNDLIVMRRALPPVS
jgi:RimJ/RimL family protein N-acetyltransferase